MRASAQQACAPPLDVGTAAGACAESCGGSHAARAPAQPRLSRAACRAATQRLLERTHADIARCASVAPARGAPAMLTRRAAQQLSRCGSAVWHKSYGMRAQTSAVRSARGSERRYLSAHVRGGATVHHRDHRVMPSAACMRVNECAREARGDSAASARAVSGMRCVQPSQHKV